MIHDSYFITDYMIKRKAVYYQNVRTFMLNIYIYYDKRVTQREYSKKVMVIPDPHEVTVINNAMYSTKTLGIIFVR